MKNTFAISPKTVEALVQAKRNRLKREMYKALQLSLHSLSFCYDPSEDNKNNPTMQSIGKALEATRAALAKADGDNK